MNRIAQFFSRRRNYDNIASEIRQHVAEKTDELVESGMLRDEAEQVARREFGNLAAIEEEAREAWGWSWLEDFIADLRYGVRQIARNPLVALVCIITLALGIGANTAIFTAVDDVLFRPLPFKDSGSLVLVSEYRPGNVSKTGSPLSRFRTRAAENSVFEETGGYWDVSGGNGMVFGSSGSAERVRFSVVTTGFFSILGVQPEIGRSFSPSEDLPSGANVFLASDSLWHRLLGGDPQSIGKTFRLDGQPYTLIGVLPPDFRFPGVCDIWTPVGTLGAFPISDRVSHQFWMLGRLRRGVSLVQAQAQLDSIQQHLAQMYPATDANWRVLVTPLLDEFVGNIRSSLWILFAAVAFVLLIGTNVLNILLARSVAREREFAVRAALGAGRMRLIRQMLTETLVIAVLGTTLALLLAKIGLRVIVAIGAGSIPRFDQPQLNGTVLGFSAILGFAITLLVGLAPGFHASSFAFVGSLRSGQRSGTESRRSRTSRNTLIVVEFALTAVLLMGAGLMLRSFQQLRRVDPGFRTEQLVSMKIALPDALYPRTEQRGAFLQTLLERLNSAPGIATAAAVDRLPLSGDRNWGGFDIVGRPLLDSAHAPAVEGRAVSANYFHTVGMPLLKGREFSEADIGQDHHVVIINQATAAKFWPGQDPVGQRITSPYRPTAPPNEIIGVVGNIKDFALDTDSPPEMYTPMRWWNETNLVLRSQLGFAALTDTVKREVAVLDTNVPVYDGQPMDERVSHSIARQRFDLLLLALFALVALLLAAVGIYGVLAFSVNRRTQEIGVRLALGATPVRTLALIVLQGMKLVLIGLVAGAALSFVLIRLMRGLLFQVSPADPVTFAMVALLLTAVGVLACLVPARRAMRVDPVVALRSE